ncbi:hypothetical protein LTR36_006521 [Oleoguttula mirabilis]|uniref:NTF2-like domain-containing protein n=1 Tax=Oleoguttula mirabilis TaxID=1507867 RepID=A0AAV9JW27_9PEZI|nr:hypothetical protein LTR36_006521 [Oleoguttula mirabilis]
MRSFTAIATASLIALSAASPEPIFKRDDAACMTQAEAQVVANNFQELIADYTVEAANAYLTTDFEDNTDSVTELINGGCSGPETLGVATFTSRAAFEAAQGAQDAIPFEQLNVWYNCDTVFLRWRTALTPESVTGIIVGETTQNTNATTADAEPWLINTLYSEFNSGAWLVDTGSFVPTGCSSSTRRMLRV